MIADAMSRIMGMSHRSINNPAVPLSSKNIMAYFAGSKSNSGESVTADTALGQSSVWRATALISGDVATIPMYLYQRTSDGRTKATKHPVYTMARWKPGAYTANIWRRRAVAQMLLYGNSYSRIVRAKSGGKRLILLHPDDVVVKESSAKDGSLVYVLKKGLKEEATLTSADVLHLQNLSTDVFGGLSIVEYARNTIGRHLSSERYTDDFFANGTIPAGWFKSKVPMKPEAMDRFIERYREAFATPGSKHRAGILEDDMDWISTSVNPKDAMLIDMLQLSPYDIARYFNCPPHKLGIQGLQSSSNTDAENGDYWTSTIHQILCGIEYEWWDKLLREDEKTDDIGGYYFEFLMDAMMRATTRERFETYRLAVSSRIMSPNECRAKENMNSYDGGDQFENPYTSSASGGSQVNNAGSVPGPSQEPAPAPSTDMPKRQHVQAVVQDALTRAGRRLSSAAEQAAKSPGKFLDLIEGLRSKHDSVIRDSLRAVVTLAVGEEEAEHALDYAMDSLFLRAQAAYVAASDCLPNELVGSAARASTRLLGDLGVLASEIGEGKWQLSDDLQAV